MADRLVTVVTFDLAPEAQAAKNALEDAGIRAVVTDEATVSMLWEIANAVGGVKVQVREEDAEKALAVLGYDTEPQEIDADALAAEAEAATPEDEDEPREAFHEPAESAMEPVAVAIGSREHDAQRLFLIAWLGIIFPPLSYYALYVLLTILNSREPLSSRGRFNLIVGGSLTVASQMLIMVLLGFLRDD